MPSKTPATKAAAPAAAAKPAAAAAAKGGKAAAPAAKTVPAKNPLIIARPKNFGIGGDIRHKTDLARYVRWPKYVRLQRQKKILMQRLKVPPAIHQFSRTLDKNQAAQLFKLLTKYLPETHAEKAARLEAKAAAVAAKTEPAPATAARVALKYGLKHVTSLIEKKKAKLVLIAHDVDPIELVVWLPALCRKMDVPFAIVKGKARLGTLTHKKTASVVALTRVNKEDESALKTLQDNFHAQFNETVERKWGGGVMGVKTQAKMEKRRIAIETEKAKKLEAQR